MGEKISIIICDADPSVRKEISLIIEKSDDYHVVGEADTSEAALHLAERLVPWIVIMDYDLPGGALDAIQMIAKNVRTPSVLLISNHADAETMKDALLAGARDYIVKPFSEDVLMDAVKKVFLREKRRKVGQIVPRSQGSSPSLTIVACGAKGGVGKTTIITNLAIALRRQTNLPVLLIDLDLQFGDLPVLLDVMPRMTISELVQETGDLSLDLIDKYVIDHDSGIQLLAAPIRPEYADYVNGKHIERIVKLLKNRYAYILIDTPPHFADTVLAAMDEADLIMMVTNLELTSLRGTKAALEILRSLHYPPERMRLVINRCTEQTGISPYEAEESIGSKTWAKVPSDLKLVTASINLGRPFVISNPKSPIAQSINDMAVMITNIQKVGGAVAAGVAEKPKRASAKIFRK